MMANERKPRNQWDSVDENGHDWNSGEDFDPTPRQQTTAPTVPTTPTQQSATPVAQTARVQRPSQPTASTASTTPVAQTAQVQPPQTPVTTTTAYPSTVGQANSYSSTSYPALTALREQAAQTAQANKLSHVDTSGQRSLLEQFFDSQRQQVNTQVDRGVTQGVNELARVNEDAQEQFQTQRNQIDIDERRALDNRAAYDAARGVLGGIAGEQYSSIMNTAAQNRVTVSKAQTQLANDIYRQIAELRANGEFQKADAALELSQQYLQQLFQLEQWALQTNLSIDQFNAQVGQWAASYNLQLEQMGLQIWQADEDNRFRWAQLNRSAFESDRNYNRGVFESDRAYDYQAGRDKVLDARDLRNFNYQAGRDLVDDDYRNRALNQDALESNRDYNLRLRAYNDQRETQRNQELASSGWTKIDNGITPDADERRAMGDMSYEDARLRASLSRAQMELGITSAQLGIDATRAGIDATRANTENTKANTEATRLGTEVTRTQLSALNDGTSGATGSFDTRATTLFQDAKASGNPQSYITNNYKRYGFSSSSGLYNDYKNWASGASSGGVSYDDAIKDVSAGRWSDSIYAGLKTRMSDMDIIRTFNQDYDESSGTGYLHSASFRQYMERKAGPGIPNNEYSAAIRLIENTLSSRRESTTEQKLRSVQSRVQNLWPRLNFQQRLDLVDFLYNNNIDLSDIG